MNIHITSDGGGYDLKSYLISNLESDKIKFYDYGVYKNESVDYPTYAFLVCDKISSLNQSNDIELFSDFGILICRTGIGMSIAANRYKSIRAALCTNTRIAQITREHNNSNVLALGSDEVEFSTALEIVKIFINTKFQLGRHLRRINLLDK